MAAAGDRIGPYILEKRLGTGASKDVWRASKTNRFGTTRVALAILGDAFNEEALIKEAQIWRSVGSHPNVNRLIDIEEFDGHVVILSDCVEGGSLSTWLEERSGAPIEERLILKIVQGILAGLNHLHCFNPSIIHRDLKPGNVLMHGETPVLTDFGLSRWLDDARSQHIAGTPAYMAPEIFENNYSVKSDLWAVGVIMHRMLSGEMPFGEREMDLWPMMQAIQTAAPRPLPPAVSGAARQILAGALQKRPEDRYESARQMPSAVEAALNGDAPSNEVSRNGLPQESLDTAPLTTDQPTVHISRHPAAPRSISSENPVPTITTRAHTLSRPAEPRSIVTRIVSNKATIVLTLAPGVTMELARIPSGDFLMGDDDRKNNPRCTVSLDAYYIQTTTVTVAQYRVFCLEMRAGEMPPEPLYQDANFNPGWRAEDHPIVCVSFHDAQAFCAWVSEKTGRLVRLPTEQEWEKAARGVNGKRYPWGNEDLTAINAGRLLWSSVEDAKGRTNAVARFAPNEFGLYDMAGNVWQWCDSVYDDEHDWRVVRGGSCYNGNPVLFRSAYRHGFSPGSTDFYCGFRCALGP